MKLFAPVLLSLLVCSLAIASSPSSSDKGTDLLVTTDWLAKHLNDENLVLLHANWTRSTYKKGHIPGARFLWINALAKDTPDRNTELPSKKEGAEVLRDLGITDHSRIVVYFEGGNMTMTTRMILTLTYLGLGDRVSLLDGSVSVMPR